MALNFTPLVWIHLLVSLVPLVAGVPVARGLLAGRDAGRWTDVFLPTTIATTATGFVIPAAGFTPAHATGILASLVIAAMILARYVYSLAGLWRWVWPVGLVVSFYLDAFVLVAQLFNKVPALARLAPGGGGPVFGGVQLVLLAVFVALGWKAARRYHAAR